MFFQVVDFDHLFHLLFFLPDEGKTENCSEESLDLFFFILGLFFLLFNARYGMAAETNMLSYDLMHQNKRKKYIQSFFSTA